MNVEKIFELSKILLSRQVYVRYLHASDITIRNASSTIVGSHHHQPLNVTNIQNFIISSGPKGNSQNSAAEHVEGLTTKSAFFVLSDTVLMQDIVIQVRPSYKHNVIYIQNVH